MLNLTLEALGEKIPNRVRTGWHEVPVAHYANVFNLEGNALIAGMFKVDQNLIEMFPHEPGSN